MFWMIQDLCDDTRKSPLFLVINVSLLPTVACRAYTNLPLKTLKRGTKVIEYLIKRIPGLHCSFCAVRGCVFDISKLDKCIRCIMVQVFADKSRHLLSTIVPFAAAPLRLKYCHIGLGYSQ